MSRYKTLVDSSVWIEFFRSTKTNHLDSLLQADLICTNEIILTELLPILEKNKHYQVMDSLLAIDCIPLKTNWEIIRKYQLLNLQNGVNKVGIPDLLILQQVIDERLTLLSYDKHFELMQNHLSFDLISDQP